VKEEIREKGNEQDRIREKKKDLKWKEEKKEEGGNVRMRVVVRYDEKEEVKEMRMCEKERVDEIEGA
jgi:hypothetical protein